MSRFVGIMAFDPGGTTGVAWGVYDLDEPGIVERLDSGVMVGEGQLTGGEPYQAAMMYEKWRGFQGYCAEKGWPSTVIVEDFILRPGKATADREGLSPIRLTALFEGILIAGSVGTYMAEEEDWALVATAAMPVVVKQSPAQAKGFATKERLKRWGQWRVGMQHARDARRHVCLYLAGLD